jgi:hypothetical protein
MYPGTSTDKMYPAAGPRYKQKLLYPDTNKNVPGPGKKQNVMYPASVLKNPHGKICSSANFQTFETCENMAILPFWDLA